VARRNWSRERLYQAALLNWVCIPGDKITGTVTLRRSFAGSPLSESAALATAAHYLRRLDAEAFGCKGKRGKRRRRLYRVIVREGSLSDSGPYLHFHLMIQVPPGRSPEEWARTCEAIWRSLNWANSENLFQPMIGERWLEYIFKLKAEIALLDAMPFDLWHMPSARKRTEVQF
jgi:hypothetical protein